MSCRCVPPSGPRFNTQLSPSFKILGMACVHGVWRLLLGCCSKSYLLPGLLWPDQWLSPTMLPVPEYPSLVIPACTVWSMQAGRTAHLSTKPPHTYRYMQRLAVYLYLSDICFLIGESGGYVYTFSKYVGKPMWTTFEFKFPSRKALENSQK